MHVYSHSNTFIACVWGSLSALNSLSQALITCTSGWAAHLSVVQLKTLMGRQDRPCLCCEFEALTIHLACQKIFPSCLCFHLWTSLLD